MSERSPVSHLLEQCRAFVTQQVDLRSSDFSKAIGLTDSSPQFEQELTQALVEAVFFHLAPKPTTAKGCEEGRGSSTRGTLRVRPSGSNLSKGNFGEKARASFSVENRYYASIVI